MKDPAPRDVACTWCGALRHQQCASPRGAPIKGSHKARIRTLWQLRRKRDARQLLMF